MLSAGDRLTDRYRVLQLLGRGGMGEVWSAERLPDRHLVAIKVLLEKALRRRDIVKRFEREAEAAARIRSPNVCALLDTGLTQEGAMFIVFELLRGESLADRLRREGVLSFDDVARMLIDVLRGVADAHDASVLHRDLKPGNIFATSDADGSERFVVLDFGVSKLVDQVRNVDEPSLTAFDGTVGSFAYMAPEQVRGAARVDGRADVYGAGAVAFRALTGRLPFEGISARMVASLKLENSAPSLGSVTGYRWPRLTEEFFARALARAPEQRFASAAEALDSLSYVVKATADCRLRSAERLHRIG